MSQKTPVLVGRAKCGKYFHAAKSGRRCDQMPLSILHLCPCAIQSRPFALPYGLFFKTQGPESRSLPLLNVILYLAGRTPRRWGATRPSATSARGRRATSGASALPVHATAPQPSSAGAYTRSHFSSADLFCPPYNLKIIHECVLELLTLSSNVNECKLLVIGPTCDTARFCGLDASSAVDGTCCLGWAVQVDPIKPKLRPPGTKRLKPNCDVLLSNSASKSNLRRYTSGR